MGKKSKRPNRRNRAKRGRVRQAVTPDGGLKIVVATSPSGDLDVEVDVRLVRSALLYADTVELLSPAAVMLSSLSPLASGGPADFMQMMLEFDDDTLGRMGVSDIEEFREKIPTLIALQSRSRADRRAILGGNAMREFGQSMRKFSAGSRELTDKASEVFDQSEMPELAEAYDAGLLTVADAFDLGDDPDAQVEAYTEALKRLLADPKAYLLFDDRVADFATSMVKEGKVTPNRMTLDRISKVSAGTGFVARLPAFPDTKMTHVLEARQELADPLVKYRRGVAHLSEKLSGDPLDSTSAEAAIDDLWHDEVEPALADLRSQLSNTRIVRDAAISSGTDKTTVAAAVGGPFLAVGITSLAELAAAGLGLLPSAAQVAVNVAKEANEAKDAAKGQDLYYLLELDRRL